MSQSKCSSNICGSNGFTNVGSSSSGETKTWWYTGGRQELNIASTGNMALQSESLVYYQLQNGNRLYTETWRLLEASTKSPLSIPVFHRFP